MWVADVLGCWRCDVQAVLLKGGVRTAARPHPELTVQPACWQRGILPQTRACAPPYLPVAACPTAVCRDEEEEQGNGVEVPSSEEESEPEDAPLDAEEEEKEVRWRRPSAGAEGWETALQQGSAPTYPSGMRGLRLLLLPARVLPD